MSMDLGFKFVDQEQPQNGTVIKVVGVGGAGGNAVNHMIAKGLKGVEFISANTDAQSLSSSQADHVIALGTTGLGAGAKPENGRAAAEAAREQIRNALAGAHMVFITAGMGGGTGTGASPVVAQIARELGILTVGVVTKPFGYEGTRRMKSAEEGIQNLTDNVNALIVVLNDRLEDMLGEDATMQECFVEADDVLHNACAGIAEIINVEGNINVDFEDVKTIMSEQGQAMMGTAVASGEDRAKKAAEEAIACPLLEGVDLNGARGVLINITASSGITQREVRTINEVITGYADKDAVIISGIAHDDNMGDQIRVTVVATGLGRKKPEIVVDNSEQQQLRTGTDDASAVVDGLRGSVGGFNPIRAVRGPRSGHLNVGFGLSSAATTDSAAISRRSLSDDERNDSDVPAFLRKQAN
ncbi:MAG: cell division protein FtsZ [Alcaligenaceae bacterium]|nr:cell division protein FtsZ [Alcaligenaceae bacterium]HZJ96234.1 cell division protein FtsZ [Oligella sp.]